MFKAKHIMTKMVITAQPDMPVYDAIRLLANRSLAGLPVVDADLNLLGVLSEKDVLDLLYETEDRAERTVADYMNTQFACFDVGTNLIDLCDYLMHNPFGPVAVTQDGKLAGVIGVTDLIRTILQIKHQQPSAVAVRV